MPIGRVRKTLRRNATVAPVDTNASSAVRPACLKASRPTCVNAYAEVLRNKYDGLRSRNRVVLQCVAVSLRGALQKFLQLAQGTPQLVRLSF